jgi:hypothetical protein
MLDISAEIRANRRGAERRGKGGPLGGEPNARFGGNMGYVDHLKIGGRRHGGRLDGEDSRDGDEAADMLVLRWKSDQPHRGLNLGPPKCTGLLYH